MSASCSAEMRLSNAEDPGSYDVEGRYEKLTQQHRVEITQGGASTSSLAEGAIC